MSQTFALVATGALMSVYQMTQSKNPVHSVFYLVLLFLHCSGLLVLQGLEYFVLLQQLVYVGALAIQFLFVVMLQDIPSTEILAHQRGSYPVAGVLALCIAICTFQRFWQPISASSYSEVPAPFSQGVSQARRSAEQSNSNPSSYSFWRDNRKATSPVANLGIALYGVHPDLLIIASLLLQVAMVGAVGLTLKRPVAAPDYDVFAQHYVDFQKGLVQIKNKLFLPGLAPCSQRLYFILFYFILFYFIYL